MIILSSKFSDGEVFHPICIIIAMRIIASMENNGISPLLNFIFNYDVAMSKLLFAWVEAGDSVKLDKFLNGTNNQNFLDRTNAKGCTPLMKACSLGQGTVARVLLLHHADISLQDKFGNDAMMFACNGNLECIKVLLEFNGDVNVRDKFGGTALMLASMKGYRAIVQLLLESGADASFKDEKCRSAMTFAVGLGHTSCVLTLLSYGADINGRDTRGQTQLINAVNYGHSGCVSALCVSGADLNCQEMQYGATALIYACLDGEVTIVRTLLLHGAIVDVQDHAGRTALIVASSKGWDAAAHCLLLAGAAVNHQDHIGASALLYASRNGSLASAQLLVDNGAAVNQVDNSGKTALIFASAHGYASIVAYLLDHDANINSVDKTGYSSLMHAASQGQSAVVQLLLQRGAVDGAIDPCHRYNALMLACEGDHTECVRRLLQNSSNGASCVDILGRTALLIAVSHRGLTTVEALLECGTLSIDAQDSCFGLTALMMASGSDQVDMARLLLVHGADRSRQLVDSLGKSAFDYSKSTEMKAVFEEYCEDNSAPSHYILK